MLEEYVVPRKPKALPTTTHPSGDDSTRGPSPKLVGEQPAPEQPKVSVKVRADRKECACYGLKHEVFLNCLNCGRIICKAEGPGPCYFCKSPVLSVTQQRQLLQKSLDTGAAVEAQTHLEKLLEFDRTSAARTKVIDQASDFSVPELVEPADQWLSPVERAKAQGVRKDRLEAIENQRRGPRVLSLDLKNRKVTVAPLTFTPKPSTVENGPEPSSKPDAEGSDLGGIAYCRSELPRAKYVSRDLAKDTGARPRPEAEAEGAVGRVSDVEAKRAELRVAYLDEVI